MFSPSLFLSLYEREIVVFDEEKSRGSRYEINIDERVSVSECTIREKELLAKINRVLWLDRSRAKGPTLFDIHSIFFFFSVFLSSRSQTRVIGIDEFIVFEPNETRRFLTNFSRVRKKRLPISAGEAVGTL